MYYTEYVSWLTREHSKIRLEPGSIELGPRHNPTELPNSPPWNMDWAVFFSDGKYVGIYERWFPVGPRFAGRIRKGTRSNFSFHYGSASPMRRKGGFPARDKLNHPAIIRIDCDAHGPHIHFRDEADHIAQSRVGGLAISNVDPFHFLRCVLKHREGGEDFDTLMNFTVTS